MANDTYKNNGKPSGIKEFFRKMMVSLKRKPSIIPLIVLVIGFLVYSIRLSYISDTTARIQGSGMGLAGFATMLFSMLSFAAFLPAFPRRKKTNIPMLIILLIMLGIIIFCDFVYIKGINNAYYRAEVEGTTLINENTRYIANALRVVRVHRVIMFIEVALIVLLPLYSKFIRGIKTSIEVEGNEDMAAIDISGED